MVHRDVGAQKRFITVLPGSLLVLLAAALTMTATSFVLILPLDKIEDSMTCHM